jgi:1,4-alpha-glucan branching enzyme
MVKYFTAIICILISAVIFPQVTSDPEYATENDSIVIYFNAALGSGDLRNYKGDLYAHTGVNTNKGTWQHVIGSWGVNSSQPKLTRIDSIHYLLKIGNPRTFYGLTDTSEHILQLAFVFRSSGTDGKPQSEDIFHSLYQPGISVVFNSPVINLTYGDPLRSPGFVGNNDTTDINISAAVIGTKISSLKLFINNVQAAEADSARLVYSFIPGNYNPGANNITAIAADTAGQADTASGILFVNPPVENAALPSGVEPGINYIDDNSVILALFAPKKEFVYVIGDFNDWKVNTNYFMKKYEVNDSTVTWWLQINGLTAGQEYIFQYLVDGNLRIADPYTEKVSDPWNDKYITSATYPGLKAYPDGKTSEIASYLQTGQQDYQWTATDFEKPAKTDLVIYELLVRDFLSVHNYKTLKDTLSYLKALGINAIELMPVNEFEGNSSWGYNPSFYFAPDKYYGTKEGLQAFIDACHAEGMAVIMDIVLNHAYGSNSMVRLYFENGKPSADNPWFNVESNFKNPDAQWGCDFNHESIATQEFVDRVLQFWMSEYKFDGFRFDFTKGFGNNIKPASGDNWGSLYDADRVRLLKRMSGRLWSYDSTAYVIFEHLAENKEEKELADYGIMLWGNMNYQYNEATMGYASDLSGTSYKNRGWNEPNLVAYMESHDEERLMYKNLMYGAKNGDYNIKDTVTALKRIKLAAAFFLTIPGPKMIWQFGELGYDVSIDFNGRLSEKPQRWNYLDNDERYKLYQTYAALIALKKYEAFSSSDFIMNVNGSAKRLRINHPSMNVIVIGNFAAQGQNIIPNFNNTGTWFDYFTGDSVEVTGISDFVYLEPGEFHIYTSVKLPTPPEGILTDVQEQQNNNIITEFRLEQNYPNPFNPATNIKYSVPEQGMVTLKVYDILGSEVTTLINEVKSSGTYEIRFDAGNLSSGVYFYTIKTGTYMQTKKMLLLK